jgi:hypothetical protein
MSRFLPKHVIPVLLFFLLFPLTLSIAAHPLPQETELPEPYNLSDNEGQSDGARLVIDGEGVLHAVWWDNSLTGRAEILHRLLDEDGKWSEVTILTEEFDLPYGTMFPLVHPDGQLCSFWDGASDSTNTDTLGVYSRCLTDGEWTDTEMVETSTGSSREYTGAFDPDGNLHFIRLEGAGDITFGDTKLSDDLMLGSEPKFVIDSNGTYHVAFTRLGQPFSVEYRYSTDNGAQWKAAERLSDDELASEGVSPIKLVADAAGGVHLVMNMSTAGIFYRHRTEEDSWQPSVELTQGQSGSTTTSFGVTTDANGLVHIVWHGLGVFYTYQNDDGSWTSPRMLSEAIGVGPGPDIVVDSEGTRHVVWGSIDEQYDVFYMAF